MAPPQAGLLTRLIAALSEVAPGGEATPPGEQSARRISFVGQVAISSVITIAGLASYIGTLHIYEHLSRFNRPCLSLPANDRPGSPPQEAPISNRQISRRDSLLLNQYEQTQELISRLDQASPGQQLRLNQQLRILIHGLDDFCSINSHFRAQQAGLLLVATWSASVTTILLLLMAPQGVQNTNRTERTVFFSTAFVLGIALSFLSFLDPETNTRKAVISYTSYNRLLQSLSSSLANQQLMPLTTGSTQPAPGAQPPLNSAGLVAQLIDNLDTALLSIPDPTITVNGNFARNAFTEILDNREHPPQPAGSATDPAAARPSHPSLP